MAKVEHIQFVRTGKRGRPRISMKVLKYAQVVKNRIDGKIVGVEKQIISGRSENC